MKVEIYSDIVCPWCYIGKRRFEQALEAWDGDEPVQVSYRPYQLDPSAPERAVPMDEYLERRFGAAAMAMQGRISEAAASVGIRIDWERALAVNTRRAHRLLRLAELEYDAQVQARLMEALHAAHFEHGGDVSDDALLAGLAAEAGLDRARVESYLASEEGAAELDEEFARARAFGVQSVPTFVFQGRYAVAGAQEVATFMQVLDQVAARAGEEANT